MAPALDLKPSELSSSKNNTHPTGLQENRVERLYRGNKQGTIKLQGVPKFDNPYDHREWIKACILFSWT